MTRAMAAPRAPRLRPLRRPWEATWGRPYLFGSANLAGVYLTFYKGPIGDRFYEALLSEKDEIERSIGIPVRWDSDGSKHWITSWETYKGSLLDDHAEGLQEMMADRVNRFTNVFRPRLSRLIEASN